MLKNKIIAKKIRNILILFMALIIMLGAYKNIRDSHAENVIEIEAVALDNYGISDNEEFVLEAREIESENENIYEIDIPEAINEKLINEIISITVDTSSEQIEVNDNKIQLTKEQVENGKISFNVKYESAVLVRTDEGQYTKELLAEKTEEEIQKLIENGEETVLIYKKVLKYEDEENEKLVQITGYLPENTRLEIEEKTANQLEGIFEDVEVSTAYDIALCRDITTKVPIETTNEDGTEGENAETKFEEYTETIAINPMDYGESVEILINDQKITENSGVYIVDENNTFDQLEIVEKINGSLKVKGYFNGVYTITDAETQSVEFSTAIGGNGDQATTDGVMTTDSTKIDYFSPASGTFLQKIKETNNGVDVYARVNYKWVKYAAWTTSTTTPTTWYTINDANSFTSYVWTDSWGHYHIKWPTTAGTWYLHVKTEDGNTYYGGPYTLTDIDAAQISFNIYEEGITYSSDVEGGYKTSWNSTPYAVIGSGSGTLVGKGFRANWMKLGSDINANRFSGTDNSAVRNPSSTTSNTATYYCSTPKEGDIYAEGLYYLSFKYYRE